MNGNESVTSKLLQEWFWHEGENLNLRTDWFLIFQAILFEAFLSAHSHGQQPQSILSDRLIEGAIIGFGLLASGVWFIVGVRNEWHIRHFRKCLQDPSVVSDDVARVMLEIDRVRSKVEPCWMRWAHQASLFAKAIPFACFAVWATFSIASWGIRVAPWTWLATVVAMWVLQLGSPEIGEEAIERFRNERPPNQPLQPTSGAAPPT